MLNFREPESKAETPLEFARPPEQSALTVSKDRNGRPLYFYTQDLPFEQLGLVAFDPENLDWWSNEST